LAEPVSGEAAAGDGRLGRALESLAGNTNRRGFLSRLSAALVAGTAGGLVAKAIKPGEADAFHFCGHTFTTGSCPHPIGLPRIDGRGLPAHPSDGQPIDNIGRRVNSSGVPIDEHGKPRRDPDGHPLPPAPRTQLCQHGVSQEFGFKTWVDGGWYRCCGGHVRKLVDCCAYHSRRINGDAALEGYCYNGRKVFCVMYFQTKVGC
jgi:hypothetical protein